MKAFAEATAHLPLRMLELECEKYLKYFVRVPKIILHQANLRVVMEAL